MSIALWHFPYYFKRWILHGSGNRGAKCPYLCACSTNIVTKLPMFIFWSKISILSAIILIFSLRLLSTSMTNIMIMISKLNYTNLSWTSTWSWPTSWSWFQRPMNLVCNVDQMRDLCVAQPEDNLHCHCRNCRNHHPHIDTRITIIILI